MTKVGIISPSNNILKLFPNRVNTGIKNLNAIGLEPVFANNYKRKNDYTKRSIIDRIDEINELIDQDIDLLIASIGGYISIQLLDKIDYKKIRNKNIMICGCSDITALLLACYVKTKNIMLYGPTYLVNLCDYEGIDEYTKDSFIKCFNKIPHKLIPSNYIVNEYIDWNELENIIKYKHQEPKDNDWKIIKEGCAKGKLIGGNLITLLLLLNTEYLPIDEFNNAILFLEDCETNILEFTSFIDSLRLNGVFDRIKGLVIGKFDTNELNNDINNFLNDYFSEYQIPIINNVDFGHVFPIVTLPIGATVSLNCEKDNIDFNIESF